jgi:iron(III) transport system substrate-binding protein
VVSYVALDREFSAPILEDYESRSGVRVLAKYDVESTKTVGLVNRLRAEASRPVCDLFWNNEIVNTIRLKRAGLLREFRPASIDQIPAEFADRDGTWYGFAGRARILLVNTKRVKDGDRPRGLEELTAEKWRGEVGLAKPLFGTTATHAACLFAVWGAERATAFFEALQKNEGRVFSGNKQVAQAVGAGEISVGWTDTDDAVGEIAAGSPVAIVYPDREPGELGTLFIPNTLALIRGGPNGVEGERLADALLRPEVERRLAEGPSAQIPLLRGGSGLGSLRVETPASVKAMAVDFEQAALEWDRAAETMARIFQS